MKEIMTNGISEKKEEYASFKGNDFSMKFQPQLLIQIKVLLQFLNDIVTKDTFLIDPIRKKQWLGKFDLLDELNKKGILKDIKLSENSNDFDKIKIIKNNFGTPNRIKKAMDLQSLLIHEHWNYFSNIVNGSARYLNNSSKIGIPYSPHPFRASFLNQTIFPDFIVNNSINNWITKERENLIEKINENSTFRIGLIPIDPIVIEIIENANSPNDLIKVALQMRKEYSKFRKYLQRYQEAINNGELKKLRVHSSLLNDIHNQVLNYKNPERYGKFTISVGFGFLKFSKSTHLIDDLLMRNGMRATLQKLILKSGSKNTMEKLLKMFDIQKTNMTNLLMENLRE